MKKERKKILKMRKKSKSCSYISIIEKKAGNIKEKSSRKEVKLNFCFPAFCHEAYSIPVHEWGRKKSNLSTLSSLSISRQFYESEKPYNSHTKNRRIYNLSLMLFSLFCQRNFMSYINKITGAKHYTKMKIIK